MIARIMGEGQYEIDAAALDTLNSLDESLESAIGTGEEDAFRTALQALLGRVREVGSPLSADSLEPSDLILPPTDASMEEVREMLGDQGLIPG